MKYSIGLLAISLSLVSQNSFALLDNTLAALRQEQLTEQTQSQMIQVKGRLICEVIQVEINKVQSSSDCLLKIREAASGKVFELTNAVSAMDLFNAGNRNILIEGILANVNTIQVKRAQNL